MSTTKVEVSEIKPDDWRNKQEWRKAVCHKSSTKRTAVTTCSHYNMKHIYNQDGGCGEDCYGDRSFDTNVCWVGKDKLKCTFGSMTSQGRFGPTTTPSSSDTPEHTCNPGPPDMVCNFDIPSPSDDRYITVKYPQAMFDYFKSGMITQSTYDTYMKNYCFSKVTSGCINDPVTGRPYASCPRYLQNGKNGEESPKTQCDRWRKDNNQSGNVWDDGVSKLCNKDIKSTYCDCAAGSMNGSNYYDVWNAVAVLPGTQNPQCWFKPCKDQDNRLLKNDEFDASGCIPIKCANITIFSGDKDLEANIRQQVTCSGSYPKQDKGQNCVVDSDCVTGYCDPKSSKCADKPTPGQDPGTKCEVSDWSDWSDCTDVPCGVQSTKTRSRTIITQGVDCPALSETTTCGNIVPCEGNKESGETCTSDADCKSNFCFPGIKKCLNYKSPSDIGSFILKNPLVMVGVLILLILLIGLIFIIGSKLASLLF